MSRILIWKLQNCVSQWIAALKRSIFALKKSTSDSNILTLVLLSVSPSLPSLLSSLDSSSKSPCTQRATAAGANLPYFTISAKGCDLSLYQLTSNRIKSIFLDDIHLHPVHLPIPELHYLLVRFHIFGILPYAFMRLITK